MNLSFQKLVLATVFSVSLLGVGCNRVPNVPKPDQPSASPGAPGTAPAPTDPGSVPAPVPADPGLTPPNPGGPPPAQPPAPVPADPGALPPNTGAPPVQPPAPTDPGAVPPAPPADPGAPPPSNPGTPPAPVPSNPVLDKFYGTLKGIGFTDTEMVTAEIKKTLALNITGWGKGAFATSDENVASKFEATKNLFATPPANPAEFFERSMAFARLTQGNFSFYIDLQVSGERKDLYILKHDNASKQMLGMNEKDMDYTTPALTAQRVRVMNSSVEGKIFFYAEERGQFLDPKRFLQIPVELINPQLSVNRVQRVVPRQTVPTYGTYRR